MSDNDDDGNDDEERVTNNALHDAAKDGNVAEVQAQVSNFNVNAQGEDGGTALFFAAYEGKREVVKLLLTLGVDVNLANVSTPTVISVHPMFIFLSHIFILHSLGMCCYNV